jgi:hypothetical protein
LAAEETEYTKFKDYTFPLVLIWSVSTSYFLDLARNVKESPFILPKICFIVADTEDFGTLCDKAHNWKQGKEPPQIPRECSFPEYIRKSSAISARELEFVAEDVKNDMLLYRFLKAISDHYGLKGKPAQDKVDEFETELKKVSDRSGLLSI